MSIDNSHSPVNSSPSFTPISQLRRSLKKQVSSQFQNNLNLISESIIKQSGLTLAEFEQKVCAGVSLQGLSHSNHTNDQKTVLYADKRNFENFRKNSVSKKPIVVKTYQELLLSRKSGKLTEEDIKSFFIFGALDKKKKSIDISEEYDNFRKQNAQDEDIDLLIGDSTLIQGVKIGRVLKPFEILILVIGDIYAERVADKKRKEEENAKKEAMDQLLQEQFNHYETDLEDRINDSFKEGQNTKESNRISLLKKQNKIVFLNRQSLSAKNDKKIESEKNLVRKDLDKDAAGRTQNYSKEFFASQNFKNNLL